MYHADVNVNLMAENVIQIKVLVDASAKNIICLKKFIWNPATVSCRSAKYLPSIIDNSVITCQSMQILMKKMQSVKQRISIFYLLFY